MVWYTTIILTIHTMGIEIPTPEPMFDTSDVAAISDESELPKNPDSSDYDNIISDLDQLEVDEETGRAHLDADAEAFLSETGETKLGNPTLPKNPESK